MAWKLERQGYALSCGRTDELTNWEILCIAFLKNLKNRDTAFHVIDDKMINAL